MKNFLLLSTINLVKESKLLSPEEKHAFVNSLYAVSEGSLFLINTSLKWQPKNINRLHMLIQMKLDAMKKIQRQSFLSDEQKETLQNIIADLSARDMETIAAGPQRGKISKEILEQGTQSSAKIVEKLKKATASARQAIDVKLKEAKSKGESHSISHVRSKISKLKKK